MSTKDLKALERRFYSEWNKGKSATMTVIDETCSADIVFHSSNGTDVRGLKDFKEFMSEMCQAFPDLHATIDDIIAEGDKAVVRYTMTGTHKGEMTGIPPTNKKVAIWAISIDRVVDGKFVESWSRMDTLGFMQQLGVVPSPGKRK